MEQKYLTAKEAARMLRVTERALQKWRKKKLLVPKTIGGKLLYTIEDIEKALHNAE
ncbi:MAG TPA: helix-turn-helix domain-containing protein [Chitinophagaceae bacterium]|nr:helix-turn-helix domain-containing protein [Chitinophagaceae bacterium]